MNTFDGCCGSCVHLNTNDYVNHKDHCYCTYRRQYYNLTEKKCSYYQYDPNKDYYDLNRRWHIVSAILHIIPEASEIPGMDKLRDFRVNILEKDAQYDDALRTYDIVGPFLARQLVLAENRQLICSSLIKNWLINIIQLIVNQEYHMAFTKYADMVNDLAERYQDMLREYASIKLIPENSLLIAV